MDEKDLNAFSWSGLFLVTSVCSFAFGAIVKLLEGTMPVLFLFAGFASLLCWILYSCARAITQASLHTAKEENNR